MAISKGIFQLSGSISTVSFYSQKGSDKVIVRTKGGASKAMIAKSPKFKELRKHQKEWSGCSKFGSLTRYAFGGLHKLADFNLTPGLNGMGKKIMKLDTEFEIGQRRVSLSKFRSTLDGFNFNRKNQFNSVLRVGLRWEIDREHLQATVNIPRINTENDLMNFQRLPYFRLIIALGTVSDMHYEEAINDYAPANARLHGTSQTITGEWHSAQTILPEHTMLVQMSEKQQAALTNEISILLSMGVEFGTVGFTGEPVEVKYAGCGKVLAVI